MRGFFGREMCLTLGAGCLALLLAQCVSPSPRIASHASEYAQPGEAISRGIAYLWHTQATAETERSSPRASFEGDWDQHFGLRVGPLRFAIHDTSPFIPACVVHSLRKVSAGHAPYLGIGEVDWKRASEIRARVIGMIQRFDMGDGTVGYWPVATADPTTIPERLHCKLIRLLQQDEALHGTLSPRGVAAYPPEYRITPDIDTTSAAWVARHVDHSWNATSYHRGDLREVLPRFTWHGSEPLYFPTVFVPPPGVYGTFLIPPEHPDIPREVDLVVNCRILYALALHGAGDSPEARKITAWILDLWRSGRLRRPDELAQYYRWDYCIPSAISSCYRDGGVTVLAPVVEQLASEVRASARTCSDGAVFWDDRNRIRSTANAVLTLLNAGDRGPLVEGAVRYLLAQQDARTGGWHAGWFPLIPMRSGRIIDFKCDAAVTASVVDALCGHQLSLGRTTPYAR